MFGVLTALAFVNSGRSASVGHFGHFGSLDGQNREAIDAADAEIMNVPCFALAKLHITDRRQCNGGKKYVSLIAVDFSTISSWNTTVCDPSYSMIAIKRL